MLETSLVVAVVSSVNNQTENKTHKILNKTDSVLFFYPLSQLCRMNGNTAVTAVQVPGPARGLDQDLAHALAAEAETTSSKALPR